MVKVRQRHAYPKSVLRSDPSVPSADMIGSEQVGLPNALASLCSQPSKSMEALPAVVAREKTTASAPTLSFISLSRNAARLSAWSQVMRVQPGSGSPLGLVRTIG